MKRDRDVVDAALDIGLTLVMIASVSFIALVMLGMCGCAPG